MGNLDSARISHKGHDLEARRMGQRSSAPCNRLDTLYSSPAEFASPCIGRDAEGDPRMWMEGNVEGR